MHFKDIIIQQDCRSLGCIDYNKQYCINLPFGIIYGSFPYILLAHIRLMTIGEAFRTFARSTLGKTFVWAIERAQEDMSLPAIKQRLVT